MPNTVTLLANASAATGAQLDANWTLVSNQAPIPCATNGTNDIGLNQVANQAYTVTAYLPLMQFSGVFSDSNNGPMTAQFGSLARLNVYKQTSAGPALLVGGEAITGNAFTLMYDPNLNSNAGGFHLFTGTDVNGTTINPAAIKLGTGSVFSRYLTTISTITFGSLSPGGSTFTVVLLAGAVPNDNVLIGPPSIGNVAVGLRGEVSASGSVVLTAFNAGAASVTVATGVYRTSVFA